VSRAVRVGGRWPRWMASCIFSNAHAPNTTAAASRPSVKAIPASLPTSTSSDKSPPRQATSMFRIHSKATSHQRSMAATAVSRERGRALTPELIPEFEIGFVEARSEKPPPRIRRTRFEFDPTPIMQPCFAGVLHSVEKRVNAVNCKACSKKITDAATARKNPNTHYDRPTRRVCKMSWLLQLKAVAEVLLIMICRHQFWIPQLHTFQNRVCLLLSIDAGPPPPPPLAGMPTWPGYHHVNALAAGA
jgi:hypothetical protein